MNEPKALQSGELACVVMMHYGVTPWIFHKSTKQRYYSKGYKTQEAAIKAAFANGFDAVKLPNGQIIKRKSG